MHDWFKSIMAKYRNKMCNYVKKCEECEEMLWYIKNCK